MPPIVLSKETKDRIDFTKAPMPPKSLDPLIGKMAVPLGGPYKGLQGRLYPVDNMLYQGEFGKEFKAEPMVSDKSYLLRFYYDDGSFFCALPVNKEDVYYSEAFEAPTSGWGYPSGSGTMVRPLKCNMSITGRVTSSSAPFIDYFVLPDFTGTVTVTAATLDIGDILIKMTVYWANDLENPITETHLTSDRINPHSTQTLEASFFSDLDYNPNMIAVKIEREEGSLGKREFYYHVDCPV